jgi:hypothetical protein
MAMDMGVGFQGHTVGFTPVIEAVRVKRPAIQRVFSQFVRLIDQPQSGSR